MSQIPISYSEKVQPVSKSGLLLWQLLPEVYRNWDGSHGIDPRVPDKKLDQRGDLANYLDAYGILFDEIKNTILQRLDDTSPETCQDWLIPYFADLLDVKLVSPDIAGQRMEVARAISWRQRKGTIGCIEEITREVGRYKQTVLTPSDNDASTLLYQSIPTVVVQEGYRRVATTVIIDKPLPSFYTLGLEQDQVPDLKGPLHSALRPGLPAGTIDFRYLSYAEESAASTRVTQTHAFDGVGKHWQQRNLRGIPCSRDSYQDSSVRTVDVRTPSWNKGHYHPHRTLLYTAPREGFFSATQYTVDWGVLKTWYELFDTTSTDVKPFIPREDAEGEFQERVLDSDHDIDGNTIISIERLRAQDYGIQRQRIVGVELAESDAKNISHRTEQVGEYIFYLKTGFELIEEKISDVDYQKVTLCGFGETLPLINLNNMTPSESLSDLSSDQIINIQEYIIEDLVMLGSLNLNDVPLKLYRCAIQNLTVTMSASSVTSDNILLGANDSLLESVITDPTGDGVCQLEYCTVLKILDCSKLQASDCLLIEADFTSINLQELYLRYSSAPKLGVANLDPTRGRVYEQTITRTKPVFFNENFGQAGCAVLHPASDIKTRTGAEDGGEMGAYHHRHYVLREQAVVDKLKEFLPVTQQPVLIVHANWDSPVSQA